MYRKSKTYSLKYFLLPLNFSYIVTDVSGNVLQSANLEIRICCLLFIMIYLVLRIYYFHLIFSLLFDAINIP